MNLSTCRNGRRHQRFHLEPAVRLVLVLVGLIATETGIPALELVSKTETGVQGDNTSEDPAVSADGRFVTFRSHATNLVASDTNHRSDVFVKDRQSGMIERVSVSTGGVEGNSNSFDPAISASGRFVGFNSYATNLVADDTNGQGDVFLYDRDLNVIERVSVSTAGAEADADCHISSVSEDGRYVCYWSDATNLVIGDTNGARDVFVRDRQAGHTIRVSTNAAGGQATGPSSGRGRIAGAGPWVLFSSTASNLVAGDTNGAEDVFAKHLETGAIERISTAAGGAQANGDSIYPSASSDGRYVAFVSFASNLVTGDTNDVVDIFIKDRETGEIRRVSLAWNGAQAASGCSSPILSADGSTIAFVSSASNLVPGDFNGKTDTFVVYLPNGEIRRASVRGDGTEGNGETYSPGLSADGALLVFMSYVPDLLPEDQNGSEDVFAASTLFEQPDDLVGRSSSLASASGNGLYNLTGNGQEMSLISRKAKRLSGHFHLQNDGNGLTDLISQGSRGNRFFLVRYLGDSGNVTAELNGARHRTSGLAPGQARSFKVTVIPQKSTLSRKRVGRTIWLRKAIPLKLSTTSAGANPRSDAAILMVRHR
jgi:Tol biopolymer transport system component